MAATNGLGRRVEVLEAAAEEMRNRRLAAEFDVTPAEVAEVAAFVERLRVRGCTLEEILERCADRWGLPLDELRRTVKKWGVDVD